MRPGIWQILIIVLLVVVIFGSRRLPEMMRSLGEGIKGFRSSLKDDDIPTAQADPQAPPTEAKPAQSVDNEPKPKA